MKPLDVRKLSNLSRIIPLEEPLNNSEPKKEFSRQTFVSVERLLFTTNRRLACCIPSMFSSHFGVSLPNATS